MRLCVKLESLVRNQDSDGLYALWGTTNRAVRAGAKAKLVARYPHSVVVIGRLRFCQTVLEMCDCAPPVDPGPRCHISGLRSHRW